MPEKTLSTHILNKHDVDTNWEDSSYVAKSGELIVYDIDSNNTSPRLKIGDGNTVTSDLPFTAAGSIYSGTLPVGTDLNTLYGNQYWGKIYWLVDTHDISNTPNSVTSGSVEIIRAGYSSTIQIFRTSAASSSSSRPTSYQRRIDDQNPDSPTEWEEIVTAEGSYPSLISGGVQCTQLYNNADLNDCVPENNKVFQAWVCTGNGTSNTMSNTPFANFGRTFYLTAVKTWRNPQDNNSFNVVQTLYSVSAGGDRLIWTRAIDGAGALGWSDWKEMVVADGSYPTLGAGYLAKTVTVATTDNTAQYGWWRFANLPFSTLTAIKGTSSYSAILLVNSVNPAGISSPGAIQSGLIELDLRLDGGEPTIINANDVMKVLCGGLSPDLFCCTVSDTEIEFYVYLNGPYNRRNFTVLNEVYYNGERVDALEFESTFVSSSAPSGAIYAVVRNNASTAESDGDGNVISTTYAKQTGSYPTLGAGYLATQIKITANSSALVGWNKFAEISYGTVSTNYSYSAILLVNGVHSTQLSTNVNTSESGKIEIDFYKEVSANPTQIGISVLSGNINVNEICAVLDSANSKIYLYSYFNLYQSISYLLISEEQVLSSKPAKLAFVSGYYGTTAPTGAVYAVVRNIASYAESIPAASQTVVGGAKMYKDSEGYFCIDTE